MIFLLLLLLSEVFLSDTIFCIYSWHSLLLFFLFIFCQRFFEWNNSPRCCIQSPFFCNLCILPPAPIVFSSQLNLISYFFAINSHFDFHFNFAACANCISILPKYVFHLLLLLILIFYFHFSFGTFANCIFMMKISSCQNPISFFLLLILILHFHFNLAACANCISFSPKCVFHLLLLLILILYLHFNVGTCPNCIFISPKSVFPFCCC